MNNTLSLSVILPIKSAKAKDFDEYFEKAISSLKNQQVGFEELVIVHSQEQSLIDI
jgi:glycosyltransferase involved in cell wall biosynthesis